MNYTKDIALGGIPRGDLERIAEWVTNAVGESSELTALKSVAIKGDKLYLKTRCARSGDMIKSAKALVQELGWTAVNPLVGISWQRIF